MQQDVGSNSNDGLKIVIVGIVDVGPINLGFDLADEIIKIIGIASNIPIHLGYD